LRPNIKSGIDQFNECNTRSQSHESLKVCQVLKIVLFYIKAIAQADEALISTSVLFGVYYAMVKQFGTALLSQHQSFAVHSFGCIPAEPLETRLAAGTPRHWGLAFL